MIRITTLITISALAISISLLQAQTIVLLNGVPTKVMLEGTKIVSIGESVDAHMAGYAAATTEIEYSDNPDFIDATSTDSYRKPSSTAIASTPVTSAPTAAVDTPTPPKVKPEAVLPAVEKPLVAGNYFNFSGNSALLSASAIDQIKEYSQKILTGEASSVLLESFFDASNKRSEELVQNRLDACKRYFEVNGIANNLVQVNKIADKTQSNKVSVRLK